MGPKNGCKASCKGRLRPRAILRPRSDEVLEIISVREESDFHYISRVESPFFKCMESGTVLVPETEHLV